MLGNDRIQARRSKFLVSLYILHKLQLSDDCVCRFRPGVNLPFLFHEYILFETVGLLYLINHVASLIMEIYITDFTYITFYSQAVYRKRLKLV